eukprot:maker-scaffold470_size172058-snap-gene-0.32 protein:Tk09896 transcript:maker-scaffold470_size172058-snap-gene-0.32-mRNA-1 annotation:"n-acetyllactosaminide beta- -n-acetylglucosaminyl- isoform a isoform x2"
MAEEVMAAAEEIRKLKASTSAVKGVFTRVTNTLVNDTSALLVSPGEPSSMEALRDRITQSTKYYNRLVDKYMDLMELDIENVALYDGQVKSITDIYERTKHEGQRALTKFQVDPAVFTKKEEMVVTERQPICKVQSALKPPILTRDSTPEELKTWIRPFKAYYSTSAGLLAIALIAVGLIILVLSNVPMKSPISYVDTIPDDPVNFLSPFAQICKATNWTQSQWTQAQLALSEEAVIQRTRDCPGYMRSLSHRFENNSHPIGFAISMYHQPAILELFLATSFHPQDSYCFHLDPKAPLSVETAFNGLIQCYQEVFPNTAIIVISRTVPVFWGHFSVLQADLKCLRALRAANKVWKDFINPAATELPITDMTGIRNKLSTFEDSIVDSFLMPDSNLHRLTQAKGLLRVGGNDFDYQVEDVGYIKAPPPWNITILKGSKNVALKRDFVDFILDDKKSWTLLNWLSDSFIPDEHFYSTLITVFKNRNEGIVQDIATDHTHGGCVRLSWWYISDCQGSNVRGICNFGMGDLERLQAELTCLFANKFNLNADALAPICHSLTIS